MAYDITYQWTTQFFASRMKNDQEYFLKRIKEFPEKKSVVASSWLYEFDESELEEAERLNVLLPLIKWSVEHNLMIPYLEKELLRYYEAYINHELGSILDEDEADVIIADLIWCYKAFLDN